LKQKSIIVRQLQIPLKPFPYTLTPAFWRCFSQKL